MKDLPEGFAAGSAAANFKYKNRTDLGIIYSQAPCSLAALFTTNLFAAAPVLIDREILAKGQPVRAIVGNAGQANACTGEAGLKNCREIQEAAAAFLKIKPQEVLLISTGVIGAQFDMQKWRKTLPEALNNLGQQDAEGFTRAIMTTDAFPKFSATSLRLSGGEVRLAVMAKGAGMICPHMATMLCVCLTDAAIEKNIWQEMFNQAVSQTFNRVSVDGDTSTNDTIIGLANGASKTGLQTRADEKIFADALTEILAKTAYMLVQDGEGAKKVLHIHAHGANTDREAEQCARSVGNSQLVKTAIYGGDANWGRIINAVGYSGVKVNPAEVNLILCGIERFKNGQPVNDDQEKILAEKLQNKDIDIDISLGSGPGKFTLLASDLGHEYVTLNSDYRS